MYSLSLSSSLPHCTSSYESRRYTYMPLEDMQAVFMLGFVVGGILTFVLTVVVYVLADRYVRKG